MPEIRAAIEAGRIRANDSIVSRQGNVRVMKAAIDPVWYLPGVAARFNVSEAKLRRDLHEQTAGMYPELVEHEELKVFLPPIGGKRSTSSAIRASCDRKTPWPAACMTNATVRTFSAPTSAPAGPTSRTASKYAYRWRARWRRAWSSTIAKKAARSAKSPNFWFITRASGSSMATGREVFQAHRMRGRRAGYALPGTDAGRAALAGHHSHRPPCR